MQRVLGTLNRYSPLLMLGCFVLMLLAAAPQLASMARAAHAFLAGFPLVYAAVACACWAVVVAGLLFEKLSKPGAPRRKGLLMDVLSRLTNRAALEKMLEEQDRAVFIDAEDLAAKLKAKVIGQDAVCDDLAAQIRRRLALSQRGKPVGVFLLAGPPGTGKTYLSGRAAAELGRQLLQFDMAQFSSPHAATQLFGSPKGYVGSDTASG